MQGLRIVTAVTALAFRGHPGVCPGCCTGRGIGGSTGIGSGLGGVGGTGPSWPNGTNQAPQPPTYSVPPGGYASPAPSSTYAPPSASTAPRPSIGGASPYSQPNAPYPASSVRPPATLPLVLPEKPNGSLVFLKGCWRPTSSPTVRARRRSPGASTTRAAAAISIRGQIKAASIATLENHRHIRTANGAQLGSARAGQVDDAIVAPAQPHFAAVNAATALLHQPH